MLTKMGLAAAGHGRRRRPRSRSPWSRRCSASGRTPCCRARKAAQERPQRAGRAAERQRRHPLGPLRPAPPGPRAARSASSASAPLALPATRPAAGPARRRGQADLHHPAPGLRRALRRLRPRLQRPADDRRRRQGRRRPEGAPWRTIAEKIGATKGIVSVSPAALQQGRRHRDLHRDPGHRADRREDRGPGARHPGRASRRSRPTPGATFEVTGTTAMNIDISAEAAGRAGPVPGWSWSVWPSSC